MVTKDAIKFYNDMGGKVDNISILRPAPTISSCCCKGHSLTIVCREAIPEECKQMFVAPQAIVPLFCVISIICIKTLQVTMFTTFNMIQTIVF